MPRESGRRPIQIPQVAQQIAGQLLEPQRSPVSGGMARSGWESSMKRKRVVPERGEPTIIGIGAGRSILVAPRRPRNARAHANILTSLVRGLTRSLGSYFPVSARGVASRTDS